MRQLLKINLIEIFNHKQLLKLMKKLLFSLVLLMGAFTFANAQAVEMADAPKKSCSKSCSKTCAKTAASAAKLAAMDETIESKTCAKSGKLSYYKNSTCPVSGKMTSHEVKYSTASKTFVNVAPSDVASAAKKVSMETSGTPVKKACSKKCSKTCSKKKGATRSAEATEAAAATAAAVAGPGKVKLVSTSSSNQ